MTKRISAFLLSLTLLCPLVLTGCGGTQDKATAAKLLTAMFTAPNQSVAEFTANLTDENRTEDGTSWNQETTDQYDALLLDLFGDYAAEQCIKALSATCIVPAFDGKESFSTVPTDVKLTESSDTGSYQYVVTLNFTDVNGNQSEQTASGRIQLKDDKVIYLSLDDCSYYELIQ